MLVFYLSASIQVGISLFCLDIYNGKGINFSTLFGSFSTLKPLAITILLTLIIGVGFILLIIPGIILGLMYSQAYYILAEEPNIAVLEALKKSEKMMKGKKNAAIHAYTKGNVVLHIRCFYFIYMVDMVGSKI